MRRLVDETGLAILVVTHDLGLAWNIADRVAVMYLGRIVETGPTESLLGDPKHPYTRALLSVVPETREMEQQILTGEIPDPTRVPTGCRFHPRCPLLQSGTLSPAIANRCPTEDPGPVPGDAEAAAACWAVISPTSGALGRVPA
jgi:peptide/nickel transport system ATP-binding protein